MVKVLYGLGAGRWGGPCANTLFMGVILSSRRYSGKYRGIIIRAITEIVMNIPNVLHSKADRSASCGLVPPSPNSLLDDLNLYDK